MNFVMNGGQIISVFPEVMQELNLINGQRVSVEEFWKIIDLNASTDLAKIAIERAKSETKS